MNTQPPFGSTKQWERFTTEHKLFLEELPPLLKAISVAFEREGETEKAVDRVIYFLGQMCCEDFQELLVLAQNGLGFGALKIVRGMFERLVTARYLHLNPDDTDNYLDYHHVADYKLARELADCMGPELISPQALQEKKKARDAVKDKFMRQCREKGCDRMISGYSWSSLDIVSMASQCGKEIRDLVGICYYVPMQHTHPSVQSILSRVVADAESFQYGSHKSSEWSSRAVIAGHNLMLRNLELQAKHFPEITATVEPLLEQCFKSFHRAWPTPEASA